MNILDRIPVRSESRDNEEIRDLALEILQDHDEPAIREVFNNLDHEDELIRHDCMRVLIEIGSVKPEMISDGVITLLRLLDDPRLPIVEGAIKVLTTIALLDYAEIYVHRERVIQLIEHGSQHTVYHGIELLSRICGVRPEYENELMPWLTGYLERCLPHELPHLAESILHAANHKNRQAIASILEGRYHQMNVSQKRKADHLIKHLAVPV